MTNSETFYATFQIDDGRKLQAKFSNQNDRDGFEISLGMYRVNLGPVTEEVFLRHVDKFDGMAAEGMENAE